MYIVTYSVRHGMINSSKACSMIWQPPVNQWYGQGAKPPVIDLLLLPPPHWTITWLVHNYVNILVVLMQLFEINICKHRDNIWVIVRTATVAGVSVTVTEYSETKDAFVLIGILSRGLTFGNGRRLIILKLIRFARELQWQSDCKDNKIKVCNLQRSFMWKVRKCGRQTVQILPNTNRSPPMLLSRLLDNAWR